MTTALATKKKVKKLGPYGKVFKYKGIEEFKSRMAEQTS